MVISGRLIVHAPVKDQDLAEAQRREQEGEAPDGAGELARADRPALIPYGDS